MFGSWLKSLFGGGKQPTAPPAAARTSAPPSFVPAATPQPIVQPDEETLGEVQRRIDMDVAGGFYSEDEILQGAVDYAEADPVAIRPYAQRYLREALASHLTRQTAWPDTTDCDRLDAAFAELEADGIVSRQNFTCCGTCGASEIWDERETALASGRPARGYAFFHMQDTESAVEGYGLYLNYGAFDENPETAVAIGHEIVAGLKKHGLQPEWNGDLARRIALPLDWKRRWPRR